MQKCHSSTYLEREGTIPEIKICVSLQDQNLPSPRITCGTDNFRFPTLQKHGPIQITVNNEMPQRTHHNVLKSNSKNLSNTPHQRTVLDALIG